MKMFKKEWKDIYSNKMLLLSCLVILFIPILYAGFFLKSNWDPYGNTDKLSVAVVNEDQSVDYEGNKLAIGSDLVNNLKTNNSLDWDFVAPSEAKEGLKDRNYYMVMTIPRDFSKNAATLMDDHPQKMKLTYKTNGSLNFIGEVISKSAVKEVKKEVSENVTKAYTKALFDQVGEVGTGFTKAADGSNELEKGTRKLANGNKKITTNLTKLADSTLTFSEGADTLSIGLNHYTDGVAQLDSGAVKLNDGLGQLATNVKPLKDGITQLNKGASSLTNGLTAYTAGVSRLDSGASQLTMNNPKLQNGVANLSVGVNQVKIGSDQLLVGIKKLSASLDNSPSKESQIKLEKVLTSLPQINKGIQDLTNALGNQSGGLNTDSITKDLTSVKTNLVGMEKNLTTAGTNLYGVEENTAKLAGTIETHTDRTIRTVQQTGTFQNLDKTQQAEILEALQKELQVQTEENKALIGGISNQTGAVSSAVKAVGDQAENVSTSANELKLQLEELAGITTNLTSLKTQVAKLAAGSNQALPGAVQAITELRGGLTSVQTALTQTGEGKDKGVLQGVTELNQGLVTIQNGLAGDTGLIAGITTYTNGVSTLQKGANQLDANSEVLNSGANQLSGGMNQLAGKLPTLIDGVNQLNKGSDQLVEGTNQLTTNSGKLINGADQLADGAGQLTNGSTQLANGSTTLGDGLDTLEDGTTTLATSLQEGAKEVNAIDPTDETFTMFSNPTELIHKEYSHVPNYGAALAPYIMSMALYIGAVVFNTIYPVRKKSLAGQTGFSFWVSKLSVAMSVATMMAIIEGALLMLLGLHVQSVGKFFAIAVMAALAFMAIVTFLTITMDNVGRFIAMILLVVQLGGSGGTFPLPLTNDFFMFIHPYLPMSYSIYGFREAISGGIGQELFIQSIVVLSSILIVFSGLLYLYMHFSGKGNPQTIKNKEHEETVTI